ncbi:MAG: assembly lipoprotein LptE [Pseudomonadota bacterium]|jgi:outer membrane lipopolysaccharide assembly protein LptE/RlpB
MRKNTVNNRFISLISAVCLGLLVCVFSGCGFHLNHASYLSSDLSSTQIQLQKPLNYGHFYQSFYSLIKQSGIILVPRDVESTRLSPETQLLWLSEPTFHERPLSYSSDGQANYVMIELTLPYEVRDVHHKPLSTGPIVLARPMSITPNALLNNDSQRNLVKEALIQKACTQLLQRLSANNNDIYASH